MWVSAKLLVWLPHAIKYYPQLHFQPVWPLLSFLCSLFLQLLSVLWSKASSCTRKIRTHINLLHFFKKGDRNVPINWGGYWWRLFRTHLIDWCSMKGRNLGEMIHQWDPVNSKWHLQECCLLLRAASLSVWRDTLFSSSLLLLPRLFAGVPATLTALTVTAGQTDWIQNVRTQNTSPHTCWIRTKSHVRKVFIFMYSLFTWFNV